jgi:hypothetical protein
MFRMVYAAFQGGYWTMAEGAAPAPDRPAIAAIKQRNIQDLIRLAETADVERSLAAQELS